MDNEQNLEKAPISQDGKWKSIGKELLIFALFAVGIVLPFRMYIAEPYLVDGRSMDPTFATGDYLIVDKISDRNGTPARNSVVIFNATNAGNPKTNFIKRIIGLPGETIIMNDNIVTIVNKEHPLGFNPDQSYVTHFCEATNCIKSFEKTLGNDEYFVMGDNRAESFDSRYWGPLSKQYVLGKPIVRLFGVQGWGRIPVPIVSKFSFLPGNDTK